MEAESKSKLCCGNFPSRCSHGRTMPMHEFTLWAPDVKKVAVKIGTAVHAMSGPDAKGWWKTSIDHVSPGDDYAFLVNRDPVPYPDPRSLWQPEGVHGPSRIYD